jgi:protein LSM14
MGNEQREKKKTSFGVHHYYHQNREGSANKDRYRSRGSDPPYRSRGGGATARGGRGQASTRQPLQYDSEFDFDSANALFAKETLEEEMEQKMKLEENEEQPIGVKPTTEDDEEKLEGYDKSTSFFDNISCEANNVTK